MDMKKLFEQFVKDNFDKAYRFAYTYTRDHHDAEDVLNESLLKAWKSIGSLRDEKNMRAWFYKIISNTALTYLKKQGSLITMEDCDLERLEFFEDKYDDGGFEKMISSLPEKYKEIIVLRFFEEMSLSEIAKVLGVKENTVKTRLYRALEILKIDIEREIRWIS